MTTEDVITTTDDVIHTIYIDLEGKLMCCKKVVCFYDNKFSTLILFSGIIHGNIDITIITQEPKIMLLVKVSLYQKVISSKTGSWLQSCKMTGHEGTCFDYNHDVI